MVKYSVIKSLVDIRVASFSPKSDYTLLLEIESLPRNLWLVIGRLIKSYVKKLLPSNNDNTIFLNVVTGFPSGNLASIGLDESAIKYN